MTQSPVNRARRIPSLRWWIGVILFTSTVINYIDRQTLSILAPFLKQDFHWTNTDYANIAIAFRVAYSIGQTVLRKADRSRRNAARADDQRDVVFVGVIADFAGEWTRELCRISFFAWFGRIGELAGSEQSGVGVVSEARTRIGGGVLRQRVVGGRSGRAVHYFADLFALGMARRVCDSGAAGIFVADRLAQDVLPAAGASADYGGRAADAADGHREGVDRCGSRLERERCRDGAIC